MMATLVLSVIGSDRPGLTQMLADAILSAGGNWLESRLSRLGGLYVGSVHVEVEAENVDRLTAAVREADAEGLEVRIAPSLEEGPANGDRVHVSLVGQDRPGIVHQVTKACSGLGANIETFETRLTEEPYAGAPLFHMHADLRLPVSLGAERVQAALEAISAEIMVDISVTQAAD
jgi:glycine cleavage system regulatory protein